MKQKVFPLSRSVTGQASVRQSRILLLVSCLSKMRPKAEFNTDFGTSMFGLKGGQKKISHAGLAVCLDSVKELSTLRIDILNIIDLHR